MRSEWFEQVQYSMHTNKGWVPPKPKQGPYITRVTLDLQQKDGSIYVIEATVYYDDRTSSSASSVNF